MSQYIVIVEDTDEEIESYGPFTDEDYDIVSDEIKRRCTDEVNSIADAEFTYEEALKEHWIECFDTENSTLWVVDCGVRYELATLKSKEEFIGA